MAGTQNTSGIFSGHDSSINGSNDFVCDGAALLRGDCLERMRDIPDRSVSLILTDPPYHSTKKKNIYGDTFFREDEDYLKWMQAVAHEWSRILKYSGSVLCFCSSAMEAKLEATFSDRFNILNHIVWTKPNDPGFDGWKQKMNKGALRQWYAHSERIIFMELAENGNLFREPFANYLLQQRSRCGLTQKELTELTGEYGKVNHGGAVANWEAGRNVPSEAQYKKICDALLATGKIDSMLSYRDLIRPFLNGAADPFTDIWEYPNVRPYKGKHPAEKPIAMLEHAILATTYEGEVVLDCFSGSGSTVAAALKLNRKAVAIEIEDKWCNQIQALMKEITELDDRSAAKIDNYCSRLADIQPQLF